MSRRRPPVPTSEAGDLGFALGAEVDTVSGMKARMVAMGLGLLAGGGALALRGAETGDAARLGAIEAGEVAPEFVAVTADGRDVSSKEFAGKVLVLNLFAPNRPPADLLEQTLAQYREHGLAVVSVCSNATRAEFDAWWKTHRGVVSYPVLWDKAGRARTDAVAQRQFGLFVFPTTIVLGRDGKVVGRFVGFGGAAPAVLRGLLRAAGLPVPEEPKPARPAGPPPDPRPETLAIGTAAPDFAAVDVAGKPVKLADFAGKIVVLDFWATWCGPCIASMPHNQRVAAATKAQDVVVLAVSTSDTRERLAQWLREQGGKFPDIVFASDPNARDAAGGMEKAAARQYGVRGIPCQFVIGRDGKIVETITGFRPGDTRLEEALGRLGVKIAP